MPVIGIEPNSVISLKKRQVLEEYDGDHRYSIAVSNIGKRQIDIEEIWIYDKNLESENMISLSFIPLVPRGDALIQGAVDKQNIEIKLHNRNGDDRALVFYDGTFEADQADRVLEFEDDFDLTYNFNCNKIMKAFVKIICKTSRSHRSLERNNLVQLVDDFWKDGMPVWLEALECIREALDLYLYTKFERLLKRECDKLRDCYTTLIERLNDEKYHGNNEELYLSTLKKATEIKLICVLIESDIKHKRANFHLLPLYSISVTVELYLCVLGIKYEESIGLIIGNREQIKRRKNKLVDNAEKYILLKYSEELDKRYKNCDPNNYFNAIMSVHTFVGLNGLAYFVPWKYLIDESKEKCIKQSVYPVYSELVGSPCLKLLKQALFPEPPLSVPTYNEVLTSILAFEIYLWPESKNKVQSIAGMRVLYSNSEDIIMGTKTSTSESYKLLDNVILKMVAFMNSGFVYGLYFHIGNDHLFYGSRIKDNEVITFELQDHFIASMFLSSNEDGNVDNIMATYCRN